MDVGLFCDTYPLELDGVGMVVKNYARELINRGARCYMIVPKAQEEYKKSDIPCELLQYNGISVPKARQYRAGVPSFDFSYLVRKRNAKMDILHAHSPFGAGLEALRLARIHDIPLVGTFHSKYYDDFYSATKSEVLSTAGVKVIISFFNSCDEVWTVTDSAKKVLRDYGYERDIIVMPNGTEAKEPALTDKLRAQRTFALNSRGPVLLYVGQQHWKKNIKNIVEALWLLMRERTDFQMVMAGQGPDEAGIKALVRELGLERNFRFTGQIMDRGLLMGLYACADLLVFPSLYDTAGLVVQEAAAAKTPALVVRGSCAAECVKDKHNGYLCENSPEDIYSTLSDILSDAEALYRVGENAQKSIPVSWSNVMDRVTDRYEMLIDRYDQRAIRLDEPRGRDAKGSETRLEDVLDSLVEGLLNGMSDSKLIELLDGKYDGVLEERLKERIRRIRDGKFDGKLEARVSEVLDAIFAHKKE